MASRPAICSCIVGMAGVLVMLAGCSGTHPVHDWQTHPVPPERILHSSYLEAAPGTGLVNVKRDAGWKRASCPLQLRVDADPVADLRTSERVVLHLPPGKYVLSVTDACGGDEKAEMQVTVSLERTVNVRLGADWQAQLLIAPTEF